ncbi:nucleic acid-binding proteins superfamily [Tasmannia lanceolata]|uniref:nucleic acid-binding proteins superfamily n=1 Tax=Tasmannia lanceolata TaxID=3420 RepID=UPI00406437AE
MQGNPCNSLSFFSNSPISPQIPPFTAFSSNNTSSKIHKYPISKKPNFLSPTRRIPKTLVFSPNFSIQNTTHVPFSSLNDRVDEISQTSETHVEKELELLVKPSPMQIDSSVTEKVSDSQKPEIGEALTPFLKFFKARDSSEEAEEERELNVIEEHKKEEEKKEEDLERVIVEYYDPKPGDLVVGVVVSGNENKLDVNVGADLLGTMLTKEVLPLYGEELSNLLCDLDKDAEEFMVCGKIGIVKDEDALSRDLVPGRPVVETGTVLFAEVMGRTLSGRPLLSTRRLFRKVAWHRVRQIKQLNEPIEVKISEWNTGGLLTRIEGLRAFLPKAELMNRVINFTGLKENVGRRITVLIDRIDEANNDLIISEREAWDMLHLQEGTLLEGTVRKIFPYGAQVRIGETNRSGLLHISNITRARISSVSDLLTLGEKVKVLVVKSMFPDKISLSIADLEGEPGLFLTNKEKVFSDAEEMAKRYRQKLPTFSVTRRLDPSPTDVLPFDDEARLYSNWNWFKFERGNGRDDS